MAGGLKRKDSLGAVIEGDYWLPLLWRGKGPSRFSPTEWSGGEHHAGFSQIYTEEIVSREIPYVDNEGLVTEVRILWSVGGWNAPNWSQSRLEGLALNYDKNEAGHDQEGEGIADEAMYEMVQTVPLPRRFVGKVWGPRGATVEYSVLLLRTATPTGDDEFEKWDNNGGKNYSIVLT